MLLLQFYLKRGIPQHSVKLHHKDWIPVIGKEKKENKSKKFRYGKKLKKNYSKKTYIPDW